jgi:hypothetical protein
MFSQLLAGSFENRSQVWQVSPTAMFAGGSVGGLILLSLILVAVWKIRVYQRKLRSRLHRDDDKDDHDDDVDNDHGHENYDDYDAQCDVDIEMLIQ